MGHDNNKIKKLGYLVGFLLIIGIIIILLSTNFRSSLQYYVTVSELKAQAAIYQNKILKVAGTASEIQKEQKNGFLAYQFVISEGGQQLPIFYQGLVPDTFKDGAQVVATGSFKEDGTFVATEILAKCASKYEAKLKK